MAHISVLKDECLLAMAPAITNGGTVVDGTLGAGGHTRAILEQFPNVQVIAIDKDLTAIERAKTRLEQFEAVSYIHGSFGNIEILLEKQSVKDVDAILLDIGFSSDQIGQSGRGFSFQYDEPLLMTLGTGIEAATDTAMDIVNMRSERELLDILKEYGEEKHAALIAKAIAIERKKQPITTTFALRDIVQDAVGKYYRFSKINPATKTFQALRIAVNDELGELTRGISGAFKKLKSGGRLLVISFHSLEDRIVKQQFNQYKKDGLGMVITKKPIVPSRKEILANSRSRSAKLRVIEKI